VIYDEKTFFIAFDSLWWFLRQSESIGRNFSWHHFYHLFTGKLRNGLMTLRQKLNFIKLQNNSGLLNVIIKKSRERVQLRNIRLAAACRMETWIFKCKLELETIMRKKYKFVVIFFHEFNCLLRCMKNIQERQFYGVFFSSSHKTNKSSAFLTDCVITSVKR
jgi:hypothetical protein